MHCMMDDQLVPEHKCRTTAVTYVNHPKTESKTAPWKTILFIRHGDYQRDARGDDYQHLTATGKEQANKTGLYLKSRFSAAISNSSNMTRARDTTEIILKHILKHFHVPSKEHSLLREISISHGEIAVSTVYFITHLIM